MRKKTMTKAMSGTLAAATLCAAFAGLAGCGGKSSNEVRFFLSGTNSQMEMYFKLTDTFNETYGKENGIKVNAVEMLAGADITAFLGSSNAPDVLMVSDDSYKKYVIGGYFADISDIKDTYTNIELGDIAPTAINRLYYNKETNTSNTTDPLYALPIDSCPTALYYNKGLMEKAGIIVISVDEKDLEKWNNNEIADNYGKKKSDYAKLNGVTVPKKGYYRSETPYYFTELSEGWVVPAENEIMVFNNRIAMNWDEAEDLAMYFSAAYNPGTNGKSKWGTTYGYFTETWFNYGWTVGGDCLYDLTGKGDWNFGLLDPNPNYIVKEGKTFTGRTGTEYKAGETIAFYDKMQAAENEVLVPDDKGGYKHADGSEAGIWEAIADEMNKGEDSALIELPSTRTAFKRYLKLGSSKEAFVEDSRGLNISPNPAQITDINPIYKQFYTGDILCFAGESQLMQEIAQYAEQYNCEWDVAPLVQYKKYADPADPDCDEVEAAGVAAGHSRNTNMGVNSRSKKQEAAKQFVKWACGTEGQKVRANNGFFPSQPSLKSELKFTGSYAPKNVNVFAEALEYQRPGDWWYMPNTLWVEAWCIDLNNNVRNNTKSFTEWYPEAITKTNNTLKNYKNYER